MEYGIYYDFDEEGEPPAVYIADNGGCGTCVVKIIEAPILDSEGGKFSWDADDWLPGPLAASILKAMNSPGFNATNS